MKNYTQNPKNRKRNKTSNLDRYRVQSVDRVFDILEALASSDDEIGITKLSSKVSLHTSTVHRLLATLVMRGYAHQNPDTGRYSLGPQALFLARSFQSRSDIRDRIRPFLQSLSRDSNENANLVILNEDEVLYFDQVQSNQAIRIFTQIGGRAPLHCTGVGKVFLTYLPSEETDRILKEKGLPSYTENTITNLEKIQKELETIRQQGYAIDNEEFEIGVFCVAAPVFNHTGGVIAAISVSGPQSRMSKDRIPKIIDLVKTCSRDISASLGYRED